MSNFTISAARSNEDLADTILLFTTYADWLGVDLTFQDFATEIASMPGKYSGPKGELFLARDQTGKAVGCAGLRPFDSAGISCEMKRLYVLPEAQGLGIGKALISRVFDTATALGYHDIRWDSLERMKSAIKLYNAIGCHEIPAYYDPPFAGIKFFRRELQAN